MMRSLFLSLALLAPTFAGAKDWYTEPDFTQTPPDKATIVLTVAIDAYPNIAFGAFNPAERAYSSHLDLKAGVSKDAVVDSLSYLAPDGIQAFNNAEATRTNVESFLATLPRVRTLVVFVDGLGWGSSQGDPMALLADTTITDEVHGWRVSEMKATLAPKAQTVVIVMNTARPGRIVLPDGSTTAIEGPSVKDFATYGAPAPNVLVLTPTSGNATGTSTPFTCATGFGQGVVGPALRDLARSGKNVTWSNLVDGVRAKAQAVSGCNLNVEATSVATGDPVVFEGSGVVATMSTDTALLLPTVEPLPVEPPRKPSHLARSLPWYAGGVVAIGGGLAAGAVFLDRVDMVNDEERARATFDSNEERIDYAMNEADFRLWSGLAFTGFGVGLAGIGMGTVQVFVAPKAQEVASIVTVPF